MSTLKKRTRRMTTDKNYPQLTFEQALVKTQMTRRRDTFLKCSILRVNVQS